MIMSEQDEVSRPSGSSSGSSDQDSRKQIEDKKSQKLTGRSDTISGKGHNSFQ